MQQFIGIGMFALWMALPWLLAVLMCRRRNDGDLQPNRRPGGIRQIFAVVLWHKHFYEYAPDTSKQLRALMRELRQSERPDMRRSSRGGHGRGHGVHRSTPAGIAGTGGGARDQRIVGGVPAARRGWPGGVGRPDPRGNGLIPMGIERDDPKEGREKIQDC